MTIKIFLAQHVPQKIIAAPAEGDSPEQIAEHQALWDAFTSVAHAVKVVEANDENNPRWVCADCGQKHGQKAPKTATWHTDTCSICGADKAVTEPRDFGILPVRLDEILLGAKQK